MRMQKKIFFRRMLYVHLLHQHFFEAETEHSIPPEEEVIKVLLVYHHRHLLFLLFQTYRKESPEANQPSFLIDNTKLKLDPDSRFGHNIKYHRLKDYFI